MKKIVALALLMCGVLTTTTFAQKDKDKADKKEKADKKDKTADKANHNQLKKNLKKFKKSQ